MSYVYGIVLAVPTANKQQFIDLKRKTAGSFELVVSLQRAGSRT